MHFTSLATQSAMLFSDPDALIAQYTRKMMSFLLFNPNPEHIVMIGLGGGSLAKFCYRHLPRSQITVVEINADVIALREEFCIPKTMNGSASFTMTEPICRAARPADGRVVDRCL